ncbi:MAG TPA: cytochrome c [Candidatus Acidoferrales bacterium]|nr:cytochrome c [Candidatus Acidoferrales bacterium]
MTERSGWVKSLRYNRCMGLWGILMLLFPLATALTAQTSAPWVVPEAARKVKNPVKSTPEALAAAAKLFRVNCMICHGKTGAGNGPTAKTLTIKPANFTDAKMMSQMTDGELFWKMSKGRGAMPAWEDQLSETERWELVNYIRTFAHKKAE